MKRRDYIVMIKMEDPGLSEEFVQIASIVFFRKRL